MSELAPVGDWLHQPIQSQIKQALQIARRDSIDDAAKPRAKTVKNEVVPI